MVPEHLFFDANQNEKHSNVFFSFLTTVRFWLPYIIETFIQPNVIKHQQQQKNIIETKTYLKFFQPFNQIWESRRTRILQSSNHFRSIENNAVTVSSLEGGPRNREEFGVGKPGRQWNHFRRGRVQKFHQMPNRIVVAVGRNLRQKLVVIHSSKKKNWNFWKVVSLWMLVFKWEKMRPT